VAYSLASGSTTGLPGGSGYLDSAERGATGTSALPLNTWSHLALSYDDPGGGPGHLRLYVNGAQVAGTPASGQLPALSGLLRIGAGAVPGQVFAGQIDEVRIYDRALPAAEIGTDMATSVLPVAVWDERQHLLDGGHLRTLAGLDRVNSSTFGAPSATIGFDPVSQQYLSGWTPFRPMP